MDCKNNKIVKEFDHSSEYLSEKDNNESASWSSIPSYCLAQYLGHNDKKKQLYFEYYSNGDLFDAYFRKGLS